jgi:hypothetical protein
MSMGQDRVKISFEYRGMLVDVLDKFILSTWRSCARQLYAVVDPVRFFGVVGVPGSSAGTSSGLSDQAWTDKKMLHTIDTLPLAQGPSWYMAQYDALIIQPHLKVEVLNSDENQPACVWRKGRAKVAGATKEMFLYPGNQPGMRAVKAEEIATKSHPS